MQPSKFENPTISISQTKATALAEEPLTSSFVSQCTSASVCVSGLTLFTPFSKNVSIPCHLTYTHNLYLQFFLVLLNFFLSFLNFFLSVPFSTGSFNQQTNVSLYLLSALLLPMPTQNIYLRVCVCECVCVQQVFCMYFPIT